MQAEATPLGPLSGSHYYAENSPIMTRVPACAMLWGSALFAAAIDGRADIYGGCSGSITWQLTGPGTVTIHQVDNGHAILNVDGQDVGTLSGGCFAGNQQSFEVTGAGVHTFRIDRFQDDYSGCQYASWGFDGISWTGQPADLPIDSGDPDTTLLENGATGADPVQTFSGAFLYRRIDVAIAGRGPAPTFARSYNSGDERVGPLGPSWIHNLDARLRIPGDGSGDVYFVGPDGNTDRFTHNPDGTFGPAAATYRTLTANPDGTYTVRDKPRTTLTFNAEGFLVAITDRHGSTSSLTYNSSGLLLSVSDPAGRGSLAFGYTFGFQVPRIASATDWASPARTVSYQYDTSGRLWKVTDREGKVTTFAYSGSTSRLTSITDARTNVALTLTYDAQGKVASQKDARGLSTGETTTFGYVVNGDETRVTTVTYPPTSFEPSFSPTVADSYTAQGWLTRRVNRPISTETLTETYTYDGTGNRTSVTDARGNTTDFCYDVSYTGAPISGSRGNQTRRIDPPPAPGQPRPVTFSAYDAYDNLTQVVAPNGVPSGATVTCATDLSAIDADFATDFAYDATGARLVSTTSRFTDPDTGLVTATTKYEYTDVANPGLATTIIPPRGNTGQSPDYTYATTMTYFGSGSRAGMLESLTDALGNKTNYDYDAVGRRTKVVDPLGNAAGGVPADHTAESIYDKEDRLTFTKLPAPAAGGSQLVTESRYDAVGNRVVVVDANGQVMTYAYDNRDGLLQVKESPSVWSDPASPPADVITTEYAYDAAGNMTRMTRAKGNGTYERATDYAYDGRNFVRRETQYPAWPTTTPTLVTSSTHNPNGNLATTIDALSRSTTLGYDALNRLASIDYSDPSTPDVAYAYDRNGNRTSMTDGTGTTSYVLDEADRLTSVTTPGPKVVGYRYDREGNRTKLIYPDATTVAYTFDKAGRMSGLTDWASRTVAYTYFPDGLVETATNPNTTVATYAYDNARRLNDIRHSAGVTTLDRFVYGLDSVGNVTSVASLVTQWGRPDGTSGSNGTWTGSAANMDEITPNDSDFLASPSNPTSSNFYEVTLSDVQPPATTTGITVRYRYAKSGDNGGRSINLTVELRQGTTVIGSQTHPNIPGVSGSGWQQASLTLTPAQAALITNYADLRVRFRPTTSGSGQGRQAQISWAETEFPAPANPITDATYGYDRLYRLTSVTDAAGSRSYTYDPVSNRLTKTAGGSTSYTYDRADRITTAGPTSITVNAVGAMTARGSDAFAYDQANRLAAATVSGTTETYTYDGDGVRFSRQVGGGPVTRYVSDVNGSLPITIDDGARKYVWGHGLAYNVAGSTTEVYHSDRLGSVRAISDGTGAVVATLRTDEFGIPTASTGISSQPFRFTGEPVDASGLTFLRARYYDPTLGRFATRDNWPGIRSSSASLNRFAYAQSNPATYRDPSGRCIQFVVASTLGGPTVIVGATVSLGCVAVVAVASAIGGVANAVLDQKNGDVIPPKSTWAGTGPTEVYPPPGPLPPPPPDPNLDPHQNPFNPVGRGAPRFGIAAILATLLGGLLLGRDELGEPLEIPKPRVLTQPTPAPGPHP